MDRKFPYTKRTLLAGAIMMAIGGGAYAQGATGQLPEFQELDADRSNYIEQQEAEQAIEQEQFASADADSDQRLSKSEYDQLKQGQGSMAQQQGDQQQMQAQADQSQQGQQARTGQDGADIVVEEQPSQVQVQQEPPQVTVQQQPPEITVVQPEPKVSIEQPQPDVRVQQAKPEVQVEQQGEPQVAIEQGGQPEVEYREQEQQQQARGDQQQEQQQASGQSIQDKTISDLSGMSVVASNGDNIGDIEKIVRSTTDNQLYAVVSGGGFLGIGEDRAAVPLDELNLQQDQLIWQQASGQEALERYGYDEQRFSEIQQEDVTVAELSGQAGGGGQTQMSFQQLDQDNSGSISQNEAQQLPQLQQQWSQADQDNSGQIDQSEFSAFEQELMQSPQSGGAQQGGGTQ